MIWLKLNDLGIGGGYVKVFEKTQIPVLQFLSNKLRFKK